MRVAIAVLCFIASGCASAPEHGPDDNFDAKCRRWIGKSSEALISSWGIPAKDYAVDGDTKLLEYRSTGGSMLMPSPVGWATMEQSCKVTFKIRSGTVTNYAWEGNSCQ